MDVTEVTSEPLAQVQNVPFSQLLQDWHTGRRLWARGYDTVSYTHLDVYKRQTPHLPTVNTVA